MNSLMRSHSPGSKSRPARFREAVRLNRQNSDLMFASNACRATGCFAQPAAAAGAHCEHNHGKRNLPK